MKRFLALLAAAITLTLAACNSGKQPPKDPTTSPTGTQATAGTQATTESTPPATVQTEPPATTQPVSIVEQEDTYWVAAECFSDGSEPEALDPAFWSVDLTLYQDGTARLRDTHERIYIQDDSLLALTWEKADTGELLFSSKLYPEPVAQGSFEEESLLLDYQGVTLVMTRQPMPQRIGQLYTPAELAGTWLMVQTEVEGDLQETMPGSLSSLVFHVTSYAGPLVLAADMENRDFYGYMWDSAYGQIAEVLSEPLYEGCENADWCVRIGDASPVDANGYPLETEFYATLLSSNKLLLQQYYTLDGAPAVSYQTYLRLPELNSWMQPESMELELSNWGIAAYTDETGEPLSLPAELENFVISLDADQTCWFHSGTTVQEGTWALENGGVLLLRGLETAEDPFWFGGVVTGYWVETEQGGNTVYRMYLYYKGGILELNVSAFG